MANPDEKIPNFVQKFLQQIIVCVASSSPKNMAEPKIKKISLRIPSSIIVTALDIERKVVTTMLRPKARTQLAIKRGHCSVNWVQMIDFQRNAWMVPKKRKPIESTQIQNYILVQILLKYKPFMIKFRCEICLQPNGVIVKINVNWSSFFPAAAPELAER